MQKYARAWWSVVPYTEISWSILGIPGFPLSVAVSPDAIHQHVKTKNEDQRWLHYIAPEYATSEWEGRGGGRCVCVCVCVCVCGGRGRDALKQGVFPCSHCLQLLK